jgi:catabolite regulation protein CreA
MVLGVHGVQVDSMMLSSNDSCSCRQTGQVDPATTTREKNELDSVYHLRMSDWSYRIVDCFGVSREIVAISFDYLNRFIASNVLPW